MRCDLCGRVMNEWDVVSSTPVLFHSFKSSMLLCFDCFFAVEGVEPVVCDREVVVYRKTYWDDFERLYGDSL